MIDGDLPVYRFNMENSGNGTSLPTTLLVVSLYPSTIVTGSYKNR